MKKGKSLKGQLHNLVTYYVKLILIDTKFLSAVNPVSKNWLSSNQTGNK